MNLIYSINEIEPNSLVENFVKIFQLLYKHFYLYFISVEVCNCSIKGIYSLGKSTYLLDEFGIVTYVEYDESFSKISRIEFTWYLDEVSEDALMNDFQKIYQFLKEGAKIFCKYLPVIQELHNCLYVKGTLGFITRYENEYFKSPYDTLCEKGVFNRCKLDVEVFEEKINVCEGNDVEISIIHVPKLTTDKQYIEVRCECNCDEVGIKLAKVVNKMVNIAEELNILSQTK